MNKFSKATEYKVTIKNQLKKSIVFPCTSNESVENEI